MNFSELLQICGRWGRLETELRRDHGAHASEALSSGSEFSKNQIIFPPPLVVLI